MSHVFDLNTEKMEETLFDSSFFSFVEKISNLDMLTFVLKTKTQTAFFQDVGLFPFFDLHFNNFKHFRVVLLVKLQYYCLKKMQFIVVFLLDNTW